MICIIYDIYIIWYIDFLRWSTFDLQKKNRQHKNIKGWKKTSKNSQVVWSKRISAMLGWRSWPTWVMWWFGSGLVFSGCFFFYLQFFFCVWCCDILEVGKSDLLCKVTTTKSGDLRHLGLCGRRWKVGNLESSEVSGATWKGGAHFSAGGVRMWGCEDWGEGAENIRNRGIDRNRLNRRSYSNVILWPFYQGKSNLLIKMRMKRGNLFLKLQTFHFI